MATGYFSTWILLIISTEYITALGSLKKIYKDRNYIDNLQHEFRPYDKVYALKLKDPSPVFIDEEKTSVKKDAFVNFHIRLYDTLCIWY